jgi:AI-2 transport protein TqsA
VRVAAFFLIAAIVVTGLSNGARIVVPMAEAILVWFIVNALADALRRTPRLGPELSNRMALTIAVIIVSVIAMGAVYSGVRSLASVGPQAVRLQTSLDPVIGQIARLIGIEAAEVIDRVMDAIGIEALMREIAVGLLTLINHFGIVAIYVAFLLADQAFFPAKMRMLFPDEGRRAQASAFLGDLAQTIRSYLWVMTQVSGATAALSYVVMLFIGLEGALFWASLVFLLNFIPTLGSIIATILPIAVALVQFQDLATAALLGFLLAAVQFTLGNIVLPRMTGETLNLSLFVTMSCLFVWGAIWGVTGMFLAVPLTAILVLIASRFPGTRWVAIAMSKTGSFVDSAPLPPGPSSGDAPAEYIQSKRDP